MCEITNGKIYVADRDIVCYKVILGKGERLVSLHHRYEYRIGQEYSVSDFAKRRCQTDYIIYEGWFLFGGWGKEYTTTPNLYNDVIETDLRSTRCGFYSYAYYGNGTMECDLRLAVKAYGSNALPGLTKDRVKCVRCRIPEGSKYMVSDNGEVFISERIVIDDAWSL